MPGVIFKEMSQPDACCGSGGSCVPTHSETSASVAARKAADSDRTGRDGEATDVSAF
jgi:glycolate oxidase iron-sulfur subunit